MPFADPFSDPFSANRAAPPRIVVGVDLAPEAQASARAATCCAADWARRSRRGHSLHLVGAEVTRVRQPSVEAAVTADGAAPDGAPSVLGDLAGGVRDRHPDLTVTAEVTATHAQEALVEASRTADLVVLARQSDDEVGARLGSVAQTVSAAASCPVLVLPAERDERDERDDTGTDAREHGPIVLGADGSEHARAASDWAFAEAARRGVAVRAVHAWTAPVTVAVLMPPQSGPAADAGSEALIDTITAASERHPEVPVERAVVHGSPERAIADAAADASLIVVGTRGRGELVARVLGSVSRGVLDHAPCPVVVVPSPVR